MAHKLLIDSPEGIKHQRRLKLPDIEGKFGLAIFIGGKELFLGLTVGKVEIERIVKKRFIKAPQATVKTFRFDPLAS